MQNSSASGSWQLLLAALSCHDYNNEADTIARDGADFDPGNILLL